jgi:hypothetical protein
MKNVETKRLDHLFKEDCFEDCPYCCISLNGRVHRASASCPCSILKKIGCRLYYSVWRKYLLWRQ